MKKITALLIVLLSLPLLTSAQWTSRHSLDTAARRTFATSFSLNGKAYLVGGQANNAGRSDVWAYDPVTDTWLQKNNFPGGMRGGSAAFVIGSKAYLIGGSDYIGHYFADVWEYDAATDVWAQKSGFPGGARSEAVGFAIGGKGYFGTGWYEVFGANSTGWGAYNDFWAYDPATDTWTAKAQFPGAQRGWAVAAVSGGKGYVGLGGNSNQNGSFSDFYEYDPATDAWTAKAGYAASVADAMAFTLGSDVYVCGGINFGAGSVYSITRKYTPATNTWSSEAAMPSGATMGAVGVTVGSRAFVGTGYDVNLAQRYNWLEFASSTATACQAPVAFSTATFATNGTAQCDGRIVVSNISNGCAPYTFSILPVSGTVTAGSGGFTVSGLCDNTYTVYVTDAGCCGTSYTVCRVPGNLPTGIAGYNGEIADLLIVPNPNNGTFNVSLGAAGAEAVKELRLVNCLGQVVPVSAVQESEGLKLRITEQRAGIYFLQVVLPGKVLSRKVQVE